MIRYSAAIAFWALIGPIATADDFDRLEGPTLAKLTDGQVATSRDRLTIADLAALPNVLEGVREAVLIVRTDRGNPSRLLVAPGFRKPPPSEGADTDPQADPAPIVVLERFSTFESGGGSTPDRLASGRGVILFEGFHFDLDSGQVVPEGQGGDLVFRALDEEAPGLEPVGGAAIFTLDSPPELPEIGADGPSAGRTIVPSDYEGRYRLFADGAQSGTLMLTVDDRTVNGRFRSDQTGTSYEVRGEVDPGTDPPIRFVILYPRTRQEYAGRLFAEGKGAIAGSLVMLDRDGAFFAVREGGTVAPGAVEAPELLEDHDGAG